MRMRVAKICPSGNKPTRFIYKPKSSGPEVDFKKWGLRYSLFCLRLMVHIIRVLE